jgi:hypothetical protein
VSRTNLARLGGLAAVIGSVLSAAISALNFVLPSGIAPPVAALLLAPLQSLGGIVSTLFFMVGLAGLYALLGRRSVLGLSGLILACLAVLAAISHPVFVIASLMFAGDPNSLTWWLISAQEAALFVRGFLLSCGVLLLGVATFEGQTLGRWGVLPLVLGSLTVAVFLFSVLRRYLSLEPGPSWEVISWLLAILVGLCWVLLGSILWSYAFRKEVEDARSTSASRSVEGPA